MLNSHVLMLLSPPGNVGPPLRQRRVRRPKVDLGVHLGVDGVSRVDPSVVLLLSVLLLLLDELIAESRSIAAFLILDHLPSVELELTLRLHFDPAKVLDHTHWA